VLVKSTIIILQAAGEHPTSLGVGEIFCYIGLKLLMTTAVGFICF
jgi:hypothetical protein